jgi:hypothetical protein
MAKKYPIRGSAKESKSIAHKKKLVAEKKVIKLEIVSFPTKKICINCPIHGIQHVVPIPNPTPRERGE